MPVRPFAAHLHAAPAVIPYGHRPFPCVTAVLARNDCPGLYAVHDATHVQNSPSLCCLKLSQLAELWGKWQEGCVAVGAAYVLGRRDWEGVHHHSRNGCNFQLWLATMLAHVPPLDWRMNRWKQQGARVNQQSVATRLFYCCHTYVKHDHGDCCRLFILPPPTCRSSFPLTHTVRSIMQVPHPQQSTGASDNRSFDHTAYIHESV
jgi:hypothetical protein